MKQPDMFPETKPPRVHRMMPDDVGDSGAAYPQYAARFKCRRCGTESEWLMLHTVKEIKRGIPCPKCNAQKGNAA